MPGTPETIGIIGGFGRTNTTAILNIMDARCKREVFESCILQELLYPMFRTRQVRWIKFLIELCIRVGTSSYGDLGS